MMLWVLLAVVLPAVLLLAVSFNFPYLVQDVQFVLRTLQIKRGWMKKNGNKCTIVDRFLEQVKTQPHKPLVLFNDETFTYKDADELSNRAARAFLQSGRLKPGDPVALLLRNEPMFLWLWLGLAKIGCSVAFLNYNLRSKSLMRCFNCCGAKSLVVGAEFQEVVAEVLFTLLEQQVAVFTLADVCQSAGVESFKDKMSRASSDPISKVLRSHVTLQSPAAYVYTSGTTGVPKAVVVTHAKLYRMPLIQRLSGVTSDDVIYISLPLYHAAGFFCFTGSIDLGVTVALRSKFSASQFWDDCRRYNVTVIQYIGELMRYLCNQPKKLNDKSHTVRLAVGNGLRADVWREFLIRFGNVQIRELYGITEGNLFLLNYSNKVGAVGRQSLVSRIIAKIDLIKYDLDKGEPLRNSSGFCIKADAGEPGLLVSEISATAPFYGYLGDLKQTEEKRLHNVFQEGDMYFNSGDLLRRDGEGFFYFHDRLGDTFRWKGENVATTELVDVLSLADCIRDACVYGVKVPGHEGRVGMAAVAVSDGCVFDPEEVFKLVEHHLPAYARPRFLRIQNSLDVTGTLKHVKLKLMEEGFDTSLITDALYFLSERDKTFVPLTPEILNSITSGKIHI